MKEGEEDLKTKAFAQGTITSFVAAEITGEKRRRTALKMHARKWDARRLDKVLLVWDKVLHGSEKK